MTTDAAVSAPSVEPRASRLTGLLGLPLLRVALVGAAALATWAVLVAVGEDSAFPPSTIFSSATMLPVNLICLLLVRRALHSSGRRARDLIDFSWRRLGTDLLWGLLWLAVLSVPYAATIAGVMFALHGDGMAERFETAFSDPETAPSLEQSTLAVLAVVSVATFAPLNAPTEELVYRGYSQGGLMRRWPAAAAILVPAAIFALQHVFYAPTPDLVVVFVAAFFVWGVGSGIIVHRQGRLMPIIVAHFLVNFFLSAPALVFAFLPAEAFSP